MVSVEPPRTALVLAAHPDDCEFGSGATLARWTAAGTRASLVVLTDGTMGSHDPALPGAQLRDRREAEARAGAAELGLHHVRFARRPDGGLDDRDGALIDELAGAIRELTPEIVITHDPWRPWEMHADHEAAGRLARAALYRAREPRAHVSGDRPPWRPGELWLALPWQPDHFEPASEAAIARKLSALLCHESQYATSLGIDTPDDVAVFAERLRAHMSAAGPEPGTPGEAFRRIALATRTAPPRGR